MAGRSVGIKVYCGFSILLLVHGNFGIENGRATGNRPLETTVKDADVCRLGKPQGRVTDGANVTYGLYPWQVGIRIRKDAKYIHHCGGTILDNHFILSAAHCFKRRRTVLYRIRTGDNDNTVEETNESEFEIDQLYIPESYMQGHLHHDDVALIKIKSDDGKGIRFNYYVQPAFLPEIDTKYEPGQDCIISGWGRTSFKGHSPKILQCARVQLINDTVCSEQHSLTPSMVCAGYMTGGREACQGDSGGPLICEVNKRFTVMGITSWGIGCGQRDKPGVYAKVAAVLPWIQQTITGKCELLTESGSNYWRMENGYYVPLFVHTFLAHATEVFIACRRGFELFDEFGNIYMEREDPWMVCYFGIWKHPFFCRQKKCPPPLIKHGSVIHGLQDGIEVICDEGYDMLVGETIVKDDIFETKCDRGLWENELPSCEPGKCNLDTRKGSNYWRYERGQPVLLDGPHISHGDTVYINCQDGYELVYKNDELYIGSKDPQITCNYGNLTENVYKCQTTCLVPRGDSYMFTSTESWDPLNTGEMVMSEERVNVTCRMNTDGNVTEETITCTDEGTFTKITLNCPKPDRTNKGNNDKVTCSDGYTLNTLECKPNDCILTTNMDRQMMVTKFGTNDVILKTGSVLKHNDRLIIDCQAGSEPRKRRFRCYLGNWTSDESNWNMADNHLLPQCRKALCNPECQNHGQCARDNECHCIPFTTGDRCQTFMCNEACTINGGECTAPDTCTCKENRYGNNCKLLACPLPVTNATITNEQKFYQACERPELTCPVGMKLNVTYPLTCLPVHGSWSHSVNCIPAHGTRCFTDSNCGDTSALTCKFGRCRCKTNNELMNSICKPKKCELLIRPGSTYWTEDENKAKTMITAEIHLPHFSRVFISCEDGYELVNNNGDLYRGHDPPAVRCDYGFWRNTYHCVPNTDGSSSCVPPPDVETARLVYKHRNKQSFRHRAKIEYECNPGMVMSGTSRFRTCSDGVFTPVAFSCNWQYCTYIDHPANGRRIDMNSKPFQYTRFKCNEGYRMIGKSYLLCKTNWKWEPEIPPKCEPVICPDLYRLRNGEIRQETHNNIRNSYGSVTIYSCFPSYKLVGLTRRRCMWDGQWEGETPTCKEITCPEFGPLSKGEVFYEPERRTAFGQAFFECDENADMFPVGVKDTAKCLLSGRWDSKLPICYGRAIAETKGSPGLQLYKQRYCRGNPFDHDVFKHGESTCAKCKQGYELYNGIYLNRSKLLSKNVNGTWKPAITSCREARCITQLDGYVIKLRDGSWPDTKIEHGTKVLVKCEQRNFEFRNTRGFNRQGSGNVESECNRGSIAIPGCIPKRCKKSSLPGLKISYTDEDGAVVIPKYDRKINNGSYVRIKCKTTRFELFFSKTGRYADLEDLKAFCKYGDWIIEEFPICKEKRCSLSLSRGERFWTMDDDTTRRPIETGQKIDSGSTVFIGCDNGFDLIDDKNIVVTSPQAQSNCSQGDWGNIYHCEPKKCAVPEIKNGEVKFAEKNELVEDQTMILIKCKDRYEMPHTKKTADDTLVNTCRLGNWTRSMPICTPKKCKLSIKDGSSYWTEDINKNKRLITAETLLPHISRVFISCEDGYELVNTYGDIYRSHHQPAVRCDFGSWKNVHRCRPKKCAVPEIKNGEVTGAETGEVVEDKTMIQIRCKSRYEMPHTKKTADDTLVNTCRLGYWTRSMPICTPKSCHLEMQQGSNYRGVGEHSKYTNGTEIKHGQGVIINCNDGYQLVDSEDKHIKEMNATLACSFGEWKNISRCRREKCTITTPTNGNVQRTKDGPPVDKYIFHGEQRLQEVYLPQLFLRPPVFFPDDRTTVEYERIGSFIRVTCENGYDIVTKRGILKSFISVCRHTDLSKDLPQCVDHRCVLPKHHNLKLKPAETHAKNGSKVMPTCKNGYAIPNGTNWDGSVCINTQWKPKLPFCEPNAAITHSTSTARSPRKTTSSTTMTTTTLDTSTDSALYIDYEELPTGCRVPDNATYTFSNLESGDMLTSGNLVSVGEDISVTCKVMSYEDYYADDITIKCLPNMTFTPINITCPDADDNQCDNTISNSEINRYILNEYKISCNTGYQLDRSNNDELICNDGKLISSKYDKLPVCKPKNCVLPDHMPPYIIVKTSNGGLLSIRSTVKHGHMVIMDCPEGFEPKLRRFVCNADRWIAIERNWKMDLNNGAMPECKPATCNPECKNQGQCLRDDKCICKPGTKGKLCEQFICDRACERNNGQCLAPGKCTCPDNRYGENCQFLTCPPPTTNATVTSNQERYKDEYPVLTCPETMRLNDTSKLTCSSEDGTWSHGVSCIFALGTRCKFRNDCGNSSILDCHNRKCSCNTRHNLVNSVCEPKTCHAPETNGTIEDMKSSYNQDDTVTIKCQSAYNVLDGPILKCTDEDWSHSGACVPAHGTRCFTVSDCGDSRSWTCRFGRCKCKANYKLLNSICKPKTCSAPETNGEISHWDKKELYYQGNIVTITCPSGFKIIGGSKLTCEGEQWSHSGTCEYVFRTQCLTINDCADLADAVCQEGVCACQRGLKHVNGKCEKVLGSECFSDTDCPMTDVHCERLYRAHAGRCNCKPGTRCGRKCSVPEIKNAEVTGVETGELVEDKTIIQINCKDRYEMIHAEKTADDTLNNTCSLGNWTRSMPICTPKKCKLLIRQGSTYWTEDENKAKTMITAETHLPHTSRVFISCDDGYELVNNQGDLYRGQDPPAVRCGYGSWRNVHHCFPKRCPAPETNGTIEDMKSSYYKDETVTIKCQSGYKVLDGSILKCGDKHWSHSGACVPVYGTQCSTKNDCEILADAVCQDGVCACESGLKHVKGKCKKGKQYTILVKTTYGDSISEDVHIDIIGFRGRVNDVQLKPDTGSFESGSINTFNIELEEDIGRIKSVNVTLSKSTSQTLLWRLIWMSFYDLLSREYCIITTWKWLQSGNSALLPESRGRYIGYFEDGKSANYGGRISYWIKASSEHYCMVGCMKRIVCTAILFKRNTQVCNMITHLDERSITYKNNGTRESLLYKRLRV